MLRPLLGTWGRALERTRVRRLRQEDVCCADCGRVPVIGEHVHRFTRDEVVCELCRPGHRWHPAFAERIQHDDDTVAPLPRAHAA